VAQNDEMGVPEHASPNDAAEVSPIAGSEAFALG
jgi:hypothetical protein